jgi:hypothetical protein
LQCQLDGVEILKKGGIVEPEEGIAAAKEAGSGKQELQDAGRDGADAVHAPHAPR